MQKFTSTVTDQATGAVKPITGAQVYIYQGGSNNLASLYQDNETGKLTNPLLTDSNGFVECKLANGTYDITIVTGTLVKTIRGFCAFDGNQSAITITMPVQFTVTGGVNVAWAPAPARKFLAGPLAGSADGAPSFRAIDGDDLPAASSTKKGAVVLASAGDVKSGTVTDEAVTPAGLASALGFTSMFLSPDQAFSGSGNQTLTIAHGLGKRPVLVVFELECKTADLEYSPGDIINLYPQNPTGSNAVGFVCYSDATNVNLALWNGPLVLLISKTNHSGFSGITNSKWVLRVRAFA